MVSGIRRLLCVAAICINSVCFCVAPPIAMGSSFEEVSAVHSILKEALLKAAKGEPVSEADVEAKVERAVAEQIAQFVRQCNKTRDPKMIATAAAVKVDENIQDQLKFLLISELTHQEIAEMEFRGIRDTLDDLGIHIAGDYSIIAGALPENQGVVRIRLPDFHSCPSCKRVLEKALNDTAGIEQAVVNSSTNTAQMVADLDLDVIEKLDEIKKNTVQLVGWKLIRKE